MSRSSTSASRDGLRSAAFLAVLWLPLVLLAFGPERELSEKELRRLAPRPAAPSSWRELAQLPAALEAWLRDHVGFREALIAAHAYLKVVWLETSPTPDILVGRDGWLFTGRDLSIDEFRGVNLFGETELERWARLVGGIERWLDDRGIEFLVVIAPNKLSVYPEFAPPSLVRLGSRSHADQVVERLAATRVDVLDLRAELVARKGERLLYHRTDTHWNDLGAHVGYSALIRRLGRTFPGLVPHPLERFVLEPVRAPGLGLASGLRLSRWLEEETFEVRPVARRARPQPGLPLAHPSGQVGNALGVDDPGLPRAVMFCDSFADALLPFLSEHFARILYVHRFARSVVETERPDVVIWEVVERSLPRVVREAQIDLRSGRRSR